MDLEARQEIQVREVVVDNYTAHPKVLSEPLKAIKVVFLPPNATSKLQPLDQGIIKNLKHKYISRIIQGIIRALDNGADHVPSMSLLDCCRDIAKAWKNAHQT